MRHGAFGSFQLSGIEQVLPKTVAQVHINVTESAFAVYEVVEMLVNELPFLVMLAQLAAVIFQ